MSFKKGKKFVGILSHKIFLGFIGIICTPAVIGILGSVLQVVDIVSVKATAWLISCLMVTMFALMVLFGAFTPIFTFWMFVSELKGKGYWKENYPIFFFLYFVLFGGGIGFLGYHSFFLLLDAFPRFIDGITIHFFYL